MKRWIVASAGLGALPATAAVAQPGNGPVRIGLNGPSRYLTPIAG